MSIIADCCAMKRRALYGSFAWLNSPIDLAVKGLAVSNSTGGNGALDDHSVHAVVSDCNFTGLVGDGGRNEYVGWPAYASALYQEQSGTNASRSLFRNCTGGNGCFYAKSGNASTFSCCSFVGCDNAIAHAAEAPVEDVCEACFFDGTRLRGNRLLAGSVLLDGCLFAGEVPAFDAGFNTTGDQVGFTSTALEIDTASLLPTCGGVVTGFPTATATPSPSPGRTPAATGSRTQMATATPSAEPYPTPLPPMTPYPSQLPLMTPYATSVEPKPKTGAIAGGIVAAAALVIVIIIAIVIIRRRRQDSRLLGSLAFPLDGPTTFSAISWDRARDPEGLLADYPLTVDTFRPVPDEVPLLIAAFRRVFLINQLTPLAARGVREQGEAAGEPEVGVRLAERLLAGAASGGEILRDNALALYTRETWLYRDANRLLRGTGSPGDARLWPFVAILQMSLIRARPKENDGGVVYRGAVVPSSALPGGVGKFVLRGFTSCSRVEARAFEFASRSAPARAPASRDADVRVMFEVKLPHVMFERAQLGNLWVGAAVNVRHRAGEFEGEEEVVLLDGTTLNVTSVSRDCVTPFDPARTPEYATPCVQVRAEVDWAATRSYFEIFNADERRT
jgi:hypothetical protein